MKIFRFFCGFKNQAYICSPERGIGVWRSWLAHLVWDQVVLRSSRSTPTKVEQKDSRSGTSVPLFYVIRLYYSLSGNHRLSIVARSNPVI